MLINSGLAKFLRNFRPNELRPIQQADKYKMVSNEEVINQINWFLQHTKGVKLKTWEDAHHNSAIIINSN